MNWKFWKRNKTKRLSLETKATLEILIHEIQQILDGDHCISSFNLNFEIKTLLDSWVKANKLHPENVHTFNIFATNAYPTTCSFTISNYGPSGATNDV